MFVIQNKNTMKVAIQSNRAPKPIGPYSQAIQHGSMVFTSGQIAIDPNSGVYTSLSVKEETHLVMKNLMALLEEVNLSFDNVVKASIFLQDMGDFSEVNEIYTQYLNAPYPARETVQVAMLPKGAKVEISMIAIQNS
ncbi:MAG: RidA family protein [Bacteroidota bacterium]